MACESGHRGADPRPHGDCRGRIAGTLQAKAVVRDVGRVLQMPYGQVDRISKLIPANPANPVTLQQALDIEPQLKAMRDSDEQVAGCWKSGRQRGT